MSKNNDDNINKSTSPCTGNGSLPERDVTLIPSANPVLQHARDDDSPFYFLYLFKVIFALLGDTAGLPPTALRPNGERFLMAAARVGESRRAL